MDPSKLFVLKHTSGDKETLFFCSVGLFYCGSDQNTVSRATGTHPGSPVCFLLQTVWRRGRVCCLRCLIQKEIKRDHFHFFIFMSHMFCLKSQGWFCPSLVRGGLIFEQIFVAVVHECCLHIFEAITFIDVRLDNAGSTKLLSNKNLLHQWAQRVSGPLTGWAWPFRNYRWIAIYIFIIQT